MKVYTVHEQPQPPADRLDRAVELVFIKEGFSWAAFLLAPFWMLANRMWWPLLLYVVALIGLQSSAWLIGVAPGWVGLIVIGIHLAIGLEADSIRRWWLDYRGWTEVGAITGRTFAECQRRFFETWLPLQPMVTMGVTSHLPQSRPAPQDSEPMLPLLEPQAAQPPVRRAGLKRLLWRTKNA